MMMDFLRMNEGVLRSVDRIVDRSEEGTERG